MGDGVLAYTPWGEMAYALAGRAGYERVRPSDEQRSAPGAETANASNKIVQVFMFFLLCMV